MEHKDRAIRAEMLRSEVEEIKANLESVESHLASAEDGPARAQFESDRDELRDELEAREAELRQVLAGSGGADSRAIALEMIRGEIADAEENLRTVSERARTAAGAARELYEKERAEIAAEIAELKKRLPPG